MMCSFRKVFFPTPDEEVEMCREAIRIHEEQIGKCSTCINMEPSTEPGFVTDYGACMKNKKFFPEKVCGLADCECSAHKENCAEVDGVRKRLEELKDG